MLFTWKFYFSLNSLEEKMWTYSLIDFNCREPHLPVAWDPVMGILWKSKWRILEA
jgi:hypothetical protein